MSDTNLEDSGEDLDDIFKNLADEVDASERNRSSRGGFSRTYENIHWTGLEKGKARVIRALGANPDFNINNIKNPKRSPFDARIVQLAEVLNDKGKKIRLVLPLEGQDDNHILWRIINKVLEGEWVKEKNEKGEEKNVRKYKHMAKYPDMVCQILHSNLPESNPQRKFGLLGKGWTGKQMFMLNHIDRINMAWHRENKHTALLSKEVREKKTDEGKILTFAEPGVPAYGFTQALAGSILKFYGFWENYDIGIERTGLTSPPMRVFSATKNPEMVLDKAMNAVISSQKGLTEEEKSWTQYNLDKLFQLTSATKILNSFKNYLTIVDANLGTHFIGELTKLSTEEKARWEAEKTESSDAQDEGEDVPVENDTVSDHLVTKDEVLADKTKPEMVKEAIIAEERHSVDMKFQLPGWNDLTKDERGLIESANKEDDGETWSIKWKEGTRTRAICIKCESRIPASFKICPCCNTDQEVVDPAF